MQDRLPNTYYVQKLEEAKDRTIDSDMEKVYMEKIKELVEDENTVKKLLMKVLEDRGKIITNLFSEIPNLINLHIQVTAEVLKAPTPVWLYS